MDVVFGRRKIVHRIPRVGFMTLRAFFFCSWICFDRDFLTDRDPMEIKSPSCTTIWENIFGSLFGMKSP